MASLTSYDVIYAHEKALVDDQPCMGSKKRGLAGENDDKKSQIIIVYGGDVSNTMKFLQGM
jgi:hypothetical protein